MQLQGFRTDFYNLGCIIVLGKINYCFKTAQRKCRGKGNFRLLVFPLKADSRKADFSGFELWR